MRVVTDRGLQQGDVAVLEMHDPDTDETKSFRMDTNDRNSPVAQSEWPDMCGARTPITVSAASTTDILRMVDQACC